MQVYHKYISFNNRIQIEVAGSAGALFTCAQLPRTASHPNDTG